MAELTREGYIERIRGRGTFIARPDKHVLTSQAPGSRKRSVGQIVIAYPDYYSFSLWSKVACAEDMAHRHGVDLVSFKMNKGTAYESVAALIGEKGSDVLGAIVLPAGSIMDTRSVKLMDSLGIPVAVLAACERPGLAGNVTSIYRDYQKEGYLAASYLIRAGHDQLGYIANEPWDIGSRLQYHGVKSALYEHGLNLKDLARSPNGVPSWESAIAGGYRFTVDLLRVRRPTALIYRSSPGALGGMRAIAEAGLRVPDDVSMISEGEGDPLNEYLVPPLTVITCEYEALLAAAFDVILDRSRRHEKQIVIDVRLTEGRSVRTVRRDGAAGHAEGSGSDARLD